MSSSTKNSICPVNQIGNVLACITSFGGVLGLASSLCVIVVIFGTNKDVYFVRERIIVGFALSNLLFSIAK